MSDNQNNNLRNFLIGLAEVSIKLKMEENIMKEEKDIMKLNLMRLILLRKLHY